MIEATRGQRSKPKELPRKRRRILAWRLWPRKVGGETGGCNSGLYKRSALSPDVKNHNSELIPTIVIQRAAESILAKHPRIVFNLDRLHNKDFNASQLLSNWTSLYGFLCTKYGDLGGPPRWYEAVSHLIILSIAFSWLWFFDSLNTPYSILVCC